MKSGIYIFIVVTVFFSGCATTDIDSDFPPGYQNDEYFPLRHFEHMTDFEHLQAEWPLLLTEDMTQC